MNSLIELNNLVQKENHVFCLPGQEGVGFDYSDGKEVEQYLEKVFSETADLSSRSPQLQEKIVDWPSEYHLSSDRSNLLRPYDLSFAKSALEFGSGCGAISRYLGEQGIAVDAVEGSEIRASLGKMRCQDLDNVSVINANYNELSYPEKHYDLILFVGVIEYASKFHPDAATDREAAVGILKHVSQYLSDDGVILVAIENRLGLKYILGQHEDHYAKKYVGIHGYKNSAGIATYSKGEWRDIVDEANLAHCGFSYPFPDYKIPRVTFGESFANTHPHAFNHLEGVFSRDYARPVKKSPTESIAWEAANSGQFLNTVANSFCLAIGNNAERIESVMDFDFCHTPSPGRKNQYSVVTRKKTNSEVVEKIPLFSESRVESNSSVNQVLDDQTYLYGNLLSTEWLRSILIYSRREEFDQWLGEYYDFLGRLQSQGTELKIDMLPINIIVDSDGNYQLFDQEWLVDEDVSREYLLFRALLTFIVTNWIHLKDFLGWLELHTVQDFVDYGFRNHNLSLMQYLDDFVSRENLFQQLTTNNDDERGVQQLLETPFDFSSDDRDIYATIYWAKPGDNFDGSRSVEQGYLPDPEKQELVFSLPETTTSIKKIRFDPFDIRKTDQIGFYSVSSIMLVAKGGPEGLERVLWCLEGEQTVAENSKTESAWVETLEKKVHWLSVTDFPKVTFELGQAASADLNERLEIRVRVRAAESAEYILAQHRYISKLSQMEKTETDLKKTLHHLESARKEIADIKSGKPFRLGMKVFSMLGKLKK
jgi:SAM-dependent methyltransferase